MSPFTRRAALSSHRVWVAYMTLLSPALVLGAVIQNLWDLTWSPTSQLFYVMRTQIHPVWADMAELFTKKAQTRCRRSLVFDRQYGRAFRVDWP